MGGALSKLSWKHWAIIGFVVCAIIGGALYSLIIKPKQEQLVAKRQELTATQEAGAKLPSAKAELAAAQRDLRVAKQRLNVYVRTKMIPLSLATEVDRFHTMVRLWHEHAEVLGPLMERHIGSSGCTMTGAGTAVFANLVSGESFRFTTGAGTIPVPAPPARPDLINAPGGWYRIPLPTITVRTSKGFPQVMEFLRSFTRAPRLIVVGAPTISGTSPNLTVTVPLQAYYLVQGVAAPAAPAGGGMPGMEPGMAPGMEPAMMPGAPAPGSEAPPVDDAPPGP
ncbi:MAG: hypothetical protein QHJ73_12240 [Armatimonadota bacterium]|nr:hypothetical protein [Armatimonadota bacterium]